MKFCNLCGGPVALQIPEDDDTDCLREFYDVLAQEFQEREFNDDYWFPKLWHRRSDRWIDELDKLLDNRGLSKIPWTHLSANDLTDGICFNFR